MIKVKIKNTKPMRIAYIEYTGDYGNVPYDEYFSKLFSIVLSLRSERDSRICVIRWGTVTNNTL